MCVNRKSFLSLLIKTVINMSYSSDLRAGPGGSMCLTAKYSVSEHAARPVGIVNYSNELMTVPYGAVC